MHLVLDTTSPGLTLGLYTPEGAAVAEITDPTPRAADTLHTRLSNLLAGEASPKAESRKPKAEAITRLTLTVGPGSFTGVRIGLAVAEALKLLNPTLHITALSTLQAHACQLTSHESRVTSHDFTLLLDAAGNTVYRQTFSETGQPLTEPTCLPTAQALEEANRKPKAESRKPILFAPANLMLENAQTLPQLHPQTLLKMAENPTYHLPVEPLYLKPLTYKQSS